MKGLTELLNILENKPLDGGTSSGNATKSICGDYTASSVGSQIFQEFLPFKQGEPLPIFPLETLPPATREFVFAIAENVQAPVDMVGSCVLAALQIACRGRYPVRLPNGHIERPCLYIAPIAQPSERKSGVIEIITWPLNDYENKYNRKYGGEINQNRSDYEILQGEIANAKRQAIKEKDEIEREIIKQELQKLNDKLAEFEAIQPLRLYGADVTPEKLADMIKSQGEVFALVSAEGGGLFENIGRYADKGGLEIYLNGYSGDKVCIDRKTSDPIVIDRPTLTIIAPCQPYVITDLFLDKQKTGRGLLSRILFIKCASCAGSRKVITAPLDERIADNYKNLCYGMLCAESSGNLSYDDDGFNVYALFFDEVESQLKPAIGELSALPELGEWAGKLHGNSARFAGLIHCIASFERGKDPLETKINADEARADVELARYFLAHAMTIFFEQDEPESVKNARYLWERIKSIKSVQFSKQELIRKTQGKKNFDRDTLNNSLKELTERGYVRVEYAQTGNAGRPSETIFVNPETTVIKLIKLINLPDDAYLVNKINLITIPANVPHIEIPAAITRISKAGNEKLSDCPF